MALAAVTLKREHGVLFANYDVNFCLATPGSIAANSPRQLRIATRLLREGQVTRLDSLLEVAATMQGACHHTRDHEEAVRAFFEKRPPKFTGE